MNVDSWAHRSSFVNYIDSFSYNDLNVVPDQHCRSTLAQHSVYRLKQYYTNVDGWARRSSFIKYIGHFLQWFKCCARSALQLNTSTTFDLSFKNSIIRMLMDERAHHHTTNIWELFLQCFECYVRSTLQINTSTTFNLSFKTVLYECWWLSATIIICQMHRKLFWQWFKCCARSALQLNTSTTLRLSLKQNYTNADGWARPSSFVKYIGTFSYNVSNAMSGQHCSSTLAQHSIYLLKTVLYECWWLSALIIIRQIYRKLFLQ